MITSAVSPLNDRHSALLNHTLILNNGLKSTTHGGFARYRHSRLYHQAGILCIVLHQCVVITGSHRPVASSDNL